jgi:nucleoside 2-deoxyribosyltransferase
MKFIDRMTEIAAQLEALGHMCVLPEEGEKSIHDLHGEARAQYKQEQDFMRKHFSLIEAGDAILVCNEPKHGISHYIGANTFLEMGLAHHLEKPIYVMYDLPEMDFHRDEILAMAPKCLFGDVTEIQR